MADENTGVAPQEQEAPKDEVNTTAPGAGSEAQQEGGDSAAKDEAAA